MLFSMLPGALFANHWLATKLALLVLYIVLGALAMRPRFARTQRLAFYDAALATFVWIVGIARMHDPAGWLFTSSAFMISARRVFRITSVS